MSVTETRDYDCAEPSGVYTRNDDVIALSALLLETNVFFTRVSAERDTQHGEESATKRCVLRKRSRESLLPSSRETPIYYTIFIQMQHAACYSREAITIRDIF